MHYQRATSKLHAGLRSHLVIGRIKVETRNTNVAVPIHVGMTENLPNGKRRRATHWLRLAATVFARNTLRVGDGDPVSIGVALNGAL
jgi:hypothetical protein